MDNQNVGLVFNIQKYSLHDGAGIRTVIFMKGCPLSCAWCCNPEGQAFCPELALITRRCIGTTYCGLCIEACLENALIKDDGGDKINVIRDKCSACGVCVDKCPSKALELFGKYMSVREVLEIIGEDHQFYTRSGGGLTISGGEPLAQPAFTTDLLKSAQERAINTAVETAGYVKWDNLELACHYSKHVFYDIKSVNNSKHRQLTGVENKIILDNFEKMCAHFEQLDITVRIPIITGFNDNEKDIADIALFTGKHRSYLKYELMPYHALGEPKYAQLGKIYQAGYMTTQTPELIQKLNAVLN